MNSVEAENLKLIEIFASVQGETTLSGLPTTFVRLAACNLRCSWCDTTYSFEKGTPYALSEIIAQIVENGCANVCITGGEPLLQKNVFPLMTALCDLGFSLSIETGGSLPIDKIDPRVRIILDVKCPGSQMEGKNLWSNINFLKPQDEIKFVLADRSDYDYAKKICQQYSLFERKLEILFSPVHDVLNSKLLVKWILADKLKVRLNLQIHKFIWDPQTKGV